MHADEKALKLQRQRQKMMGASHQEYNVELRQALHHPLLTPRQATRTSSVCRRPKGQQTSTPGIPGQDQPEQGVDARAIPNRMGFYCLGRHLIVPRQLIFFAY